MPCQKFGMDTPIMDMTVQIWSKMEYCLMAEMIPLTTPIRTAIRILTPASLKVVGKRYMISLVTGILDV